MKRRTFDTLASAGGAVLVVVLLVAGSLLMWGYTFTNSTVHDQLAQQQVFFPTRAAIVSAPASSTEIPPSIKSYLLPYAGRQVLTGPQAETYANHFIAVHLAAMPFQGVYAKVSAAAMAAPKGSEQATTLNNEVQTVFRGTTLRSMLLEAYGFWTFGQIALWAGVSAFALAGVMLLFTGLGIVHARRTSEDAEILSHAAARRAA